jgi:hypothetical protein
MNNSTSVAGSPAGTEAAMNELVAHIAANYAGPNAVLAAVLFATLEHFLGQQPGADGFAGALNQRLAALPGDRVWQLRKSSGGPRQRPGGDRRGHARGRDAAAALRAVETSDRLE